MPRPAFTSKLSLPHRLKQQSSYTNGANSTPTSVPASRTGSPKLRAMNEQPTPGLVLRANVIKVRPPMLPRGGAPANSDAGQRPRCKGPQRHLGPRESCPV